MMRPRGARFRLDSLSYESLRQQILRRDGWRCQSCLEPIQTRMAMHS